MTAMRHAIWIRNLALCLAATSLAACRAGDDGAAPTAQAAPADTPAIAPAASQAAPAWTPPSADELYQLVAPIALFPDKLVAQTLAGSAYPDQVSAANTWLAENQGMTPDALQDAANQQPWDPSIKSLTSFPAVLDQMSRNIQWTTSLGDAYTNDPNDVLNAIQVMRQRASDHGQLRTTPQQTVQTIARTNVEDNGPDVVPAPEQTYVIEPAREDVVYVPSYDPNEVYGENVVYPGYAWRPAPRFTTGEVVATGAIAFGAAILIAHSMDHHHDHDWGWHAWDMNWGGDHNHGGGRAQAVVYNNQRYVSHATTIVNRNVTINRNVTHVDNRGRDAVIEHDAPGRPAPGNSPREMGRPNFTPAMMREHAAPVPAAAPHPQLAQAAHADGRPGGMHPQPPAVHPAPQPQHVFTPRQHAAMPQAAPAFAGHAASASHPMPASHPAAMPQHHDAAPRPQAPPHMAPRPQPHAAPARPAARPAPHRDAHHGDRDKDKH